MKQLHSLSLFSNHIDLLIGLNNLCIGFECIAYGKQPTSSTMNGRLITPPYKELDAVSPLQPFVIQLEQL